MDGRCGEDFGRCPSGECCNSNGYCGTGSEYCSIGCQNQYGECFIHGTTIITKRNNIYEGKEGNLKLANTYNDTKEKVNKAMKLVLPDPAEAAEFKSFSEFALVGFENAMNFTETLDGIDLQYVSSEQCRAKCTDANIQFKTIINDPKNNFNLETYNKVLHESGQGTIDNDYYYNICINQCLLIDEFKEIYNNAKIDESVKLIKEETRELEEISNSYNNGLSKRNKYDCKVKDSYITVDHFINNDKDLPVYNSNDGSIFIRKTGGRVDGCSAHYKLLDDFVYFFTPACNGHDSCYHCNPNKNECDKAFQDNMYTLCNKGYSVIPRPKTLFACKAVAYSVRLVVQFSDLASDGYKSDREFVIRNKNTDLQNNDLGSYCVCDDYDYKHFVSKLYTFSPYI
ncbi:hypothetical protein BCR36DRAFT_581007 [Piromyces finnis]|uniref:Chitin-binding type-1 domain-containing protein n=1 Tax=Piromyces finnis TaxID=1754191 RepID=A0A1Y1VGH9_9FUNG|nr:hypothetical protein BCR36DRAFT_581007 [Piromyces finnis]|eukprot:ORX55837.1 hypothetical protein BCR36DRAFT_581007 [Piromyces finnis]